MYNNGFMHINRNISGQKNAVYTYGRTVFSCVGLFHRIAMIALSLL